MKIIEEIGMIKQGSRRYMFALFECPVCGSHVEKIKKDGLKARQCSRVCYSESRRGVKRGAYTDFVIISGYRYRYAPDHPDAIGSKKLYVAEHRLVAESTLGRRLLSTEVVHHIDENTLNNMPENLEVMSASEHMQVHKNKARRDNLGKFTV